MMAIMAISLFPLAGLVGGALDMSRLYLVKTRLQQACDAGALAGRRIMAAGTWAANNNAANTAAEQFFANNFASGSYGTSNLTRAFAETNGRVTGTASVRVPMTLMRIFGQPIRTISVACDAEMRLPNTDVMFVLDTTGSMAQRIPGDTAVKIDTLRLAVKCFYETVAKLDVDDVDCNPGQPAPSGGVGNQVQIRFGFVPYATNVNVGRQLPTALLADRWTYQSREPIWNTSTSEVWVAQGQPTVTVGTSGTMSGVGFFNCNSNYSTTSTVENGNTRTVTRITYSNVSWQGFFGPCKGTPTTTVTTEVKTTQTTQTFDKWRYRPVSFDISGLKNGLEWNDSVSLPIGANGTNVAVNWDGCIEERQTVRATNFSTIPNDALDLDFDMAPSSARPAGFTNGVPTGSYWGPALRDAVYTRGTTDRNRGDLYNLAEVETTTNYAHPTHFCPTEARTLRTWDGNNFKNYVNSLTTGGSTYHDIGLLWGARLMSPTGIFAEDNDFTPAGGEIERHIIFMTDGETCTNPLIYAAYGLPWYDRRQTDSNVAPPYDSRDQSWQSCSGADDPGTALTQQTDMRFPALCRAIRNHPSQPTLWVVYFGSTDTVTRARMENCASPGRFFNAANSADLISTFRTIADQISQLRLTR